MPSRIIRAPSELDGWMRFLSLRKFPMTVSVIAGAKRTLPQNATVHMWFADVSNQLGDSSEAEVKADCNATYGIPILRRDNPEWAEEFAALEHLNHEALRKLIRVLDVPITRKMTSKQLTEYMDQMRRDYAEAGIVLRDPDARKYEEAA